MNNTCKAGLTLLILGILFLLLITPLMTFYGVFTLNPSLWIVGALFTWIGIIFIPIGLILAIVGAITSPKEHHIYSHNYQYQQPPYNTPVQQSVQPMTNTQVKYCTNCGAQLPIQGNFCNGCGHRF